MTMETRAYGLHLLLDGYGADPARLDDVTFIFNTLNALPDLIGMRKIGFPHLARFTEREIAGVSGVVMIVESHISLHTYSKKDFLSMDVYSCKTFDAEAVASYMKERFAIRELDVTVVERGKKFPAANLRE